MLRIPGRSDRHLFSGRDRTLHIFEEADHAIQLLKPQLRIHPYTGRLICFLGMFLIVEY